jgi:hypothetical protein
MVLVIVIVNNRKHSLSERVPYVYRTHHQSDQVKGLDQERARSASKKSEAQIEATKGAESGVRSEAPKVLQT